MVVRIEPRSYLPRISFEEWDGLLRIVFVRKNKTLLASFKQTSVLKVKIKDFPLDFKFI